MAKGGFLIKMSSAAKKFPDDPEVTTPIFIEIDMVGSGKPVYTKVGRFEVGVELRDNIASKVCVKRVMSGEMAEVFHDLPDEPGDYTRKLRITRPGGLLLALMYYSGELFVALEQDIEYCDHKSVSCAVTPSD
jgi:hypothetical protein